MYLKKMVFLACTVTALSGGQNALAQDDLSCGDIEWSSMVTERYPNIANACDAVVEKDGKVFAKIEVEVMRVRGRTLTFKILNNDGSSGGNYSQTVETSWRAKIGGRNYRASELSRGQSLNVYMPHDRWAVIHEDDDGPDIEDAVALVAAPELPKTASPLPLIGMLGGLFVLLGTGLGAIRRRLS
jgi:hypothetical protein